MMDEILISLDCELSDLVDPEVRASIRETRQQLETAGVSPLRLVNTRSGAATAALSSLGPYLVPAAGIIIPTLGVIATTWIKNPGRKVKIKIGDTVIEAHSVEDVGRLLSMLQEYQAKAKSKKSTT